MDFKKFTSDAGAFLNRAVQFTEEKLGKAERTELDAHFETLITRADKVEEFTRRMYNEVQSYLEPNPTVRVEEFLYEKLEMRKEQRHNHFEALADALTSSGNEFNPSSPYGKTLLSVGAAQYSMGTAWREFMATSYTNYLSPLKNFLEGDMKTIAKERKVLQAKRLDLDSAKSKLKKARTVDGQASSKGITVEQAEADVRVAQSEFEKQMEIVKLLLEGIETSQTTHLRCLRDFVEAQMTFYAQAHQRSVDLQREISGLQSSHGGGVDLYPDAS